jgi:hypothetical protein
LFFIFLLVANIITLCAIKQLIDLSIHYGSTGIGIDLMISDKITPVSIVGIIISTVGIGFCIIVLFNAYKVQFSYTKDEIAAKVGAMKQARKERKESAQRERNERKKAKLEDELKKLDDNQK